MSPLTVDPWHALADPTRRQVFARVARGENSVTEIARHLPVSRPAVSQHLRVLLDAGLVDVRRHGRVHFYQARRDGLDELRKELESYWASTLTAFKELAEQTHQTASDTLKGASSR